jgi:hypothetical protein
MATARDLNEANLRAREAAFSTMDALDRAYASELAAVTTRAVRRFRKIMDMTRLAAADWTPPSVGDVLDVQIRTARIRRAQQAMMAAISDTLNDADLATAGGISITFDIAAPYPQHLLDQLGLRAEIISDAIREPVAHAIARGYGEGASIPQTARYIREGAMGVTRSQATMLARTDMIGLANGGNQWAVGELNAASEKAGEPKPFQSKTWLSAGDGRVRDTHASADGQTVPIDAPYNVGGAQLSYPGDPSGPNAEVCNCRCTETYGEPSAVPSGEARDLAIAASAAPMYDRPTVPWTVTEEADMSAIETDTLPATPDAGRPWWSDIAYEGLSTGDGRYMMADSLRWREPPLSLMAMIETTEGGHLGAQVAGRMDSFSRDRMRINGDTLPEGVTAIRSVGVFSVTEYGEGIEGMVERQELTGISVDLAVHEWAFRDPDTGRIIDPEEASDEDWERAFLGDYEFAVLDAEIMAATVCPTPAFADAKIAVLAAAGSDRRGFWRANEKCADEYGIPVGHMMTTLVASAEPVPVEALNDNSFAMIRSIMEPTAKNPLVDYHYVGGPGEVPTVLMAAAGGSYAVPLNPPQEWFAVPEPDDMGDPLTILPSGQVFGWLAAWDSCHSGYLNGTWSQCVTAPRSSTGYSKFHASGHVETAEGAIIPIGKLMSSEQGHAPVAGTPAAAKRFYDRTGEAAAYVRMSDGKHGIWFCGTLRPGITDEQVAAFRANAQSGDWRGTSKYDLELIAAVTVSIPGYPIAPSQLALAASADGDLFVQTLILTPHAPPMELPAEAHVLAAQIEGGDAIHAAIVGG